MANKDNEIKQLFDYSDSLVLEKIKKVLRILEQDKNKIKNEMERKNMTDTGFLYSKLINRDLEAVEEILNYQVDCDLNELSASLTKDISNKIYLRAESLTKGKLNILNNTLEKYERFCNKDEIKVISMKDKCQSKIAKILDVMKGKIEIHKKEYEIKISKDKKRKINASIKFLIFVLALFIFSYIYYKYFSSIFIENPPFNVPLEYKLRLNILFQLVIIINLLIPFLKKYWYICIASDITIILVILSYFR
jgi:hypothetical protein